MSEEKKFAVIIVNAHPPVLLSALLSDEESQRLEVRPGFFVHLLDAASSFPRN